MLLLPQRRLLHKKKLKGSIIFTGSGDALELSSFVSSGAEQRVFTAAFWIKPNLSTGSNSKLLRSGSSAPYTSFILDVGDNSIFLADANSNSTVNHSESGPVNCITEGVWQHIMMQVDTTQASSGNRVKFFVNGSEAASTIGDGFYSQNEATRIFQNGSYHICGDTDLDGKIADFIVVEGLILSPTESNIDESGKWKEYTGTFGNHGWHINPENANELGTDKSGNGNNFTPTNMSAANFDPSDRPPGG